MRTLKLHRLLQVGRGVSRAMSRDGIASMPMKPERDALIAMLAAMSRHCDEMEVLLDLGRPWFEKLADRLRHMDYAICWEIGRLKWEIEFLAACERDEAAKAKAAAIRTKRGRQAAELAVTPKPAHGLAEE